MIKLEGYKIIKKIASGGMGDVYLAEHTVLETKVAIKSLHSNLVSDEDFRKRFRTEARTQSRLSHPNIVKLIDFQERKDGLYLVMEYVEGKQLNDYIRDVTGPMPDEKLFPLFKEILSAIKYAHSKGLIHRDIKPSNILITAEGNAKIIDFGIAKSSDEDKGLTKTGVQVGTVSYMSPEQVRAKKLDLLTDIYSLGIMLFQMAVGQAPYSGQTNTFEIQLSIVSEPLPNAKDIYPSVSDKLVSIIEKATQKNKKDRFQSCDEFIKSFDKELVSKKIKSKSIQNLDKPLRNLKKTDSVKKKRKTSLFIYIVIGLISVLSITFLFSEDIKEKLYQDNLVKQVEDKYNNIEKIRLAKLEKERLAKLEKERLAKLEKERLAKLEKERLAKLEKERLAKLEKERLAKAQKEYSNGTYIGKFKNGLRHGKGKYTFKDGNIYEGYWKNDRKYGYGSFYWKDGSINDGDIYEGDFVNGVITGKGKLTYGNGGDFEGDIYEGDFLNGQRIGKGKYTWKESGNIYEGDYINGTETGKGKLTWGNGSDFAGDIYEGDFLNQLLTGKGKYTWKESGDIYEGDFINGANSGKGKYTYKNSGDVYEGDFVNLDFSGKGKYTWGNGDIFVGDFNKDVKGKGRMYFKSSGKREFGEYNERGEWKKR